MGEKIETDAPFDREDTCILLVEDDELVRQTVHMRLVRFGYSVIVAKDADEAIAVLNVAPRIDLVFSDVILPGRMNGADLACEIQQRWPAIRVVLTTGYAEALLSKVKLPESIKMLAKPYANATLDQIVRAAMTA